MYAVAASQLGASVDEMEAAVTDLLALCYRWGAMACIEHIETLTCRYYFFTTYFTAYLSCIRTAHQRIDAHL